MTTVYQGDYDKTGTKNRDFKKIFKNFKIKAVIGAVSIIAVVIFGSVAFVLR